MISSDSRASYITHTGGMYSNSKAVIKWTIEVQVKSLKRKEVKKRKTKERSQVSAGRDGVI